MRWYSCSSSNLLRSELLGLRTCKLTAEATTVGLGEATEVAAKEVEKEVEKEAGVATAVVVMVEVVAVGEKGEAMEEAMEEGAVVVEATAVAAMEVALSTRANAGYLAKSRPTCRGIPRRACAYDS